MLFLQNVWVDLVDLQDLMRYIPIQTILWLSHPNHVRVWSFLFCFVLFTIPSRQRKEFFQLSPEHASVKLSLPRSHRLQLALKACINLSYFLHIEAIFSSYADKKLPSAAHPFQCHPHLLLALILCLSVSAESTDLSLGQAMTRQQSLLKQLQAKWAKCKTRIINRYKEPEIKNETTLIREKGRISMLLAIQQLSWWVRHWGV